MDHEGMRAVPGDLVCSWKIPSPVFSHRGTMVEARQIALMNVDELWFLVFVDDIDAMVTNGKVVGWVRIGWLTTMDIECA